MRQSEGVHRIAIAIRAIGVLIVAFGIIGIAGQPPDAQVFPIVVTMAIFAGPLFVIAWIIDGFVSREQREADALIEQMRRNSELGRRALDSNPEV